MMPSFLRLSSSFRRRNEFRVQVCVDDYIKVIDFKSRGEGGEEETERKGERDERDERERGRESNGVCRKKKKRAPDLRSRQLAE